MRWRRPKSDPVVHENPEAQAALEKAESDLQDAEDRNPEIVAAVNRAKRVGVQNNFAEMIREALGGVQ